MLIAVSDIKNYLGIPQVDTTWDSFLAYQSELTSNAVEMYCGRSFYHKEYIQTFNVADYSNTAFDNLLLYHFPITSLTSVKLDGSLTSDYRLNKGNGLLLSIYRNFSCQVLEVRYFAGYQVLPKVLEFVILSIIEQNYNKKKSGVSVGFGNDVQSISISGVMKIDFDYSLESNQRKNAFGVIVGSFANILDSFRSERVLSGSDKIVEVVDA